MGKYDIGTIHKTNNGGLIEITEYVDVKRRKIKFLDGNSKEKIVYNEAINKGKIKNENIKNIYEVGNIFHTNEGCRIIIVDIIDKDRRMIEFLDSFKYKTIVFTNNIKIGAISNPFFKSIYGEGYTGDGVYHISINGKHTQEYRIWRGVLDRCYNLKFKEKHTTYKNVHLCEEWHNFQTFAKWYNDNYPYHIKDIRFDLDKDLLQSDVEHKIYSKHTCLFLPKRINTYLSNTTIRNTSGYTGVVFDKRRNKWVAQIHEFETSNNKYLGTYMDLNEASQAYQTARAINAEKAKQYLRALNYLPESIIQLIK